MITIRNNPKIWTELQKEHPFVTLVCFDWFPTIRGNSYTITITPHSIEISTGRRTRRRTKGVSYTPSATYSAKGDPHYSLHLPDNDNWYWDFLHDLTRLVPAQRWVNYLQQKEKKEKEEDVSCDEYLELLQSGDLNPVQWSLNICSPIYDKNIYFFDTEGEIGKFPPGFDALVNYFNIYLDSIGLPEIPIWRYVD